jgi:hypothetical protein
MDPMMAMMGGPPGMPPPPPPPPTGPPGTEVEGGVSLDAVERRLGEGGDPISELQGIAGKLLDLVDGLPAELADSLETAVRQVNVVISGLSGKDGAILATSEEPTGESPVDSDDEEVGMDDEDSEETEDTAEGVDDDLRPGKKKKKKDKVSSFEEAQAGKGARKV